MKKVIKANTTVIIILLICLITGILQSMNFIGFSSVVKNTFALSVVAVFIVTMLITMRMKRLSILLSDFIIIGAVLLRAWYILNTGINDRQHDEGNITLLNDHLINGGHLGYIEYFVKNHHMPDFNPFDVYSYYHPPLHHIIAACMVMINLALKVEYALAFENVQLLTLFYSAVTVLVARRILDIMSCDNTSADNSRHFAYYSALALICFHPSMTFISGSVNNDMLTIMLETFTIYFTLRFIKDKSFKNLIFIALFLGFAAISKMNAIIFALPIGLIFLMHFIKEVKLGNIREWLKKYVIFGFICGSVGLSFTIRNAVLFHEKPGILSANPDSIQYMGNYSLLTRLGLPQTLDLEYPFHSVYAKASNNVWLIMTKTSIFSEMRPDISEFGLIISRITIITAILLYLIMTILVIFNCIDMIKNTDKELGIFTLSAFLTILLTYIAFVIKYPYTCSCDFRYITISLVIALIGLSIKNNLSNIACSVIVFFVTISNIFLYFFCI